MTTNLDYLANIIDRANKLAKYSDDELCTFRVELQAASEDLDSILFCLEDEAKHGKLE